MKDALELLLGEPCYHMEEVFGHLDHVPVWRRALKRDLPTWNEFLAGYAAAVDWPASAFWAELSAANPDAVVLLSMRESPEVWWQSMDATVLTVARGERPPEQAEWQHMFHELLSERLGLTGAFDDGVTARAAYERHVREVRASIPPDRLVTWHAGDGWEPICRALDVPIPTGPFPRVNTRQDWERGDAPDRRSVDERG